MSCEFRIHQPNTNMKTLVVVLLCASSLVFAGMYAWQKSKATAAESKAAQLAKEVTAAQTEAAEHAERTVALQSRLQNVQAKAVAKADEVGQLQQVLTSQAETNAKTGNPLAEMFK